MHRVIGLAFVVLLGCGNGSGGDDDDDSAEADREEAEQLCRDVADAWGDTVLRCGGTYQQGYDVIIQGVNGDCANVIAVRDRTELINECLPWMDEVPCDVLEAGAPLDSSCNGQLLYDDR